MKDGKFILLLLLVYNYYFYVYRLASTEKNYEITGLK